MNEQDESAIEQHDHELHWRCPQLGGEVPFRYCRKLNEGLPCARVLSCWHTVFNVEVFLKRHYDPERLAAVWSRPQSSKLVQLADLVSQAAKRT